MDIKFSVTYNCTLFITRFTAPVSSNYTRTPKTIDHIKISSTNPIYYSIVGIKNKELLKVLTVNVALSMERAHLAEFRAVPSFGTGLTAALTNPLFHISSHLF